MQKADGTATLNLLSIQEPVTITGAKSDGRPIKVNVSRMASKHGWAPADYYMLETDADGNIVVEPGDLHREIWMSGHASAWTRASIAAAQQPAIAESAVTGAWLLARPQYGGTQAQKVSMAVAKLIIDEMHKTPYNRATAAADRIHPSWWLWAERGYDYPLVIDALNHGESPLHPCVVSAFGTGADPKGFSRGGSASPFYPQNLVFIGCQVDSATMKTFENVLVADQHLSSHFGTESYWSSGLTLYRTRQRNDVRPFPVDAAGQPYPDWRNDHPCRWSGMWFAHVKGALMNSTYWGFCGWKEGYSLTGEWNNGQYPQPPSIFSHNMYTSEHNGDMSWHETVSIASASVAGQMRIGGWQFDCTSVDAQVGWQNSGVRNALDEPAKATENGFLSLNVRSVVTSGGHRPYVGRDGGMTMGFDFGGVQSVDVDCLAIHLADPDNPTEIAAKTVKHPAVSRGRGSLWSNMVVFGWDANQNLTGLSEAFMKTITIQRRAGQVLGRGVNGRGTIREYDEYCATLSPRALQLEMKALNRYMLSAREPSLELPLDDRTTPQKLTFKADPRGEGFRSDSPLNWDSKDIPIDGDDLDLHGNTVKWVKETTRVGDVTFGGGKLIASSGKLYALTHTDAADVEVINCGQYQTSGAFTGKGVVRGGRLALMWTAAGNFEVSGQGQLIFGPNMTIGNGQTLRLVGDMFKAGWDAASIAGALTVEAGGTLEFHATPIVRLHASSTSPMQLQMSVMKGQTSGATGFFDSWRRQHRENTFVRIRDMMGTPVLEENTIAPVWLASSGGLIKAILPAVIGKIEAGWRGRRGAASGAAHNIVLKAGAILTLTGGALPAGTYDLTGPGITVTNQGATLPAGVTVTGGKLVLVVS